MYPVVSIILVRENPEQLTGSGCCGKLEGDTTRWYSGGDLFQHSRIQQRDMGVLHRAVRQFFAAQADGDLVQVVTVDPRNQVYLTAKLWCDVWRYRPGILAGLRTVLQLFALPVVIVNGRVVSSRKQPMDPDRLCHMVKQYLTSNAKNREDSTCIR